MHSAITVSSPQLKKILLLISAAIVCLASYGAIRVLTGTNSLRIAASSTDNVLLRPYVRTDDTAVRASNPNRTLSFAQRVAYQGAIEEVYWRHRIWPKERADSKPTFEAIMTKTQLEQKVADYLRKSQVLQDYWHRPITAQQLQAEMNRMAQHTKQPEVLRELFAVLGNDPFVIAECLARPALAERLLTSWYANDQTIHGQLKERAEAQLSRYHGVDQMKQLGGTYTESELVRNAHPNGELKARSRHEVNLDEIEWAETLQKLNATFDVRSRQSGIALSRSADMSAHSTDVHHDNLPVGKLSSLQENETSYYATTILSKTSDRLRVATVAWLKEPLGSWLAGANNTLNTAITTQNSNYTLPGDSGSVSGCTEDTWTTMSGPPDSRADHSAVWTGSEMIVWGGWTYPNAPLNTGGRYDPSTDNWATISTTNAPVGRYDHTAVWTGSEMIVWGGLVDGDGVNSGGRYNPGTNTWRATRTTNAPAGRYLHTAVWTGSEMIVWGGFKNVFPYFPFNTGGRYNPTTDNWLPTSISNAPTARWGHSAVWTGHQMIIWGGVNSSISVNTGGRYDPLTNSWTATSTTGAPNPRVNHTAVWTGGTMIIWGGDDGGSPFKTGGKYFPNTDTWLATTITHAPQGRSNYTAIWTGREMVVWGGSGGGYDLNTGGRYNPNSNSWTNTGITNAPTGRSNHTAVWSGSEMIVWGGVGPSYSYSNTGGRYNPTTNTWTPTGKTPTLRRLNAVVWTGSEMIIWGGIVSFYIDPALFTNTGGKYHPSTDTWTTTTTVRAPSGREPGKAVWTGSEMIVWGGYSYDTTDHYWNTGGRYNPNSDSWLPTSTTNAPVGRDAHSAVWTGTEMIVWGGYFYDGDFYELNSGGKYNPRTNSWTATNTANAPSPRDSQQAVWTGDTMIVWGGADGRGVLNTGGRYDPTANNWAATTTKDAPSARSGHRVIWTGSEMILWGGFSFDGNGGQIYLSTGARYDPNTNSWASTSNVNAPEARTSHTAVWNGAEMIVWGGQAGMDLGHYFNTGGRYDPSTNSWTATSTANAPEGRYRHSAVWTGAEMIVWGGTLYSNTHTSTGGRYCVPGPPPQLGNISTRAFVQTGDNVMIGGFIVQGTGSKRVIIRGIGPELTGFGVPDALADPTLEIHNSAGALIGFNDSWQHTIIGGIITSDQVNDIRNSGYAPVDPRESAIIADLPAGNYTAIVRGVNNTTGVGLVEVYDLSPQSNSSLGNISTRSFVQTADNVMIGGFIVQGAVPKKVIIRAIGPELGQFGVPDPLANPRLELYNAAGASIGSNDEWQQTIIGGVITRNQVADIQNSGHAPADRSESAIIADLPPGNYTAIVRGVNDTTGVGLVEVYDMH